MYQGIKQQWIWFNCFLSLNTLMMAVVLLALPKPLLAQDPCDAKKEYEQAEKDATAAAHKIPKPAEPTGDDGAPLNKGTVEQTLERAKEARDKAEKTKNDDEAALRQASDAMKKFNDDSQKGKRLTALQSEITSLEGQIKKAQDANSKVSKQDRLELINFGNYEVKPLQNKISQQMPNLSIDDAKEKVEDPKYTNFSNSDIDALRKEIKRNEDLIKRINDKYNNFSATPIESDDKQVQDAKNAIAEKTAELKTAIEKCRNSVRADVSALRKKEVEYDDRLKKLYPDETTRDWITALPTREADLRAKKKEQESLTTEQTRLQTAEQNAKKKLEGSMEAGKQNPGSKQAWEKAEQAATNIELNLKQIADWETKNKVWAEAEKKKNDAEKKVKDQGADYNTAVKAKDAELAKARAEAALANLDTQLNTVNKALVKEAKEEVLSDPKVVETKNRMSEKLKTLQNESDKEELRQRWKAYIRTRVRPHYIRKRNQAEANRLRDIRDSATLQKFNCFDDVQQFINEVSQAITDVLNRTASLVSDMDAGINTGADEPIPVEPIPPLDEAGGKDPTDSDCPENALWDAATKKCVCNDGFEWNDLLGKCISLEDAIDDILDDDGAEGKGFCDDNAIRGQWQRIQQLAARSDAIFSGFEGRYQKFLKEINDQNSTPCQNNLVAVAFAGGSRDLEGYEILVEEVKTVANDLIERVGVCPDLKFKLDYSQLTSLLSQIGRHSGQMKRAIADMEAQLARFGCDKIEVTQRGNQTADYTDDPNVIGDGGSGGTEICGDGVDNDGDGLQDEDCTGQSNSNITIVLFDYGNLKDDVFGLAVTGRGNLGNTPAGGRRPYPLSLPPGSYVATVTVILAPDNEGTFTITISEGSKVIAGTRGGPAQGTQVQVPFVVGQAGAGSAASFPAMNFDNAFPEEGMPIQREGNPLFDADLNREPEKMDTRGKNPLPPKRQKPAEKRPD